MVVSERDLSILEHIVSYCGDIADTICRFGAAYSGPSGILLVSN